MKTFYKPHPVYLAMMNNERVKFCFIPTNEYSSMTEFIYHTDGKVYMADTDVTWDRNGWKISNLTPISFTDDTGTEIIFKQIIKLEM